MPRASRPLIKALAEIGAPSVTTKRKGLFAGLALIGFVGFFMGAAPLLLRVLLSKHLTRWYALVRLGIDRFTFESLKPECHQWPL